MPNVFASLVQSDFTAGGHGNLEAVIESSGKLQHWFRDPGNNNTWTPAQVIVTAGAAGAGALIQSDFGSGDHGNFEVAVPLGNAQGGADLWHFFHDNSNVTLPWERAQMIAANVAGPASIIQSDFKSGDHGNFEVVVPLRSAAGGADLWHFFHDNSDVTLPWQRAQMIAANVAGPGSIIQSDFASGDHGNFEVVVPLPNAAGGVDLWHFFHDNSDVSLPWERGQMVAANVAGPGIIIQSDFKSGDHGNFEVVAPLPRGNGSQLRHFFHDNSNVALPWRTAQFITDSCNGWGCLIQSDFVENGHGNFELLVEECTRSVVAYWHPNADVSYPWLRHRVLLGEIAPPALPGTTRIAQLTGEYDRTGWNGVDTPPYAHNRTEDAFQIRGTDLGVSFPHRGRTYFLFGDTFRDNQPQGWDALDLVAYTNDTQASDGLDLAFFYNPPRITPTVPQDGFNVPLDGVSAGSSMFVFFSTDHYNIDGYDLMGRSVLTSCADEGFNFALLTEVSRYKFINVSVQRHTVPAQIAERIGLPGQTDLLWIWGSGRYRSSDVYLAVTPFATLASGALHLRFFSGSRTAPAWSNAEEDATALFPAGSVGELSVRWNHVLRRWLATFNADNPGGILLHAAPNPWGPWSQTPVRVFDPANGYGNFMHVSWAQAKVDHVQDDMFNPGQFRDDDWGGEYGPYQISTHAEAAGRDACRLYFTMSTWNPYQAMLMTTVLSFHDIPD